MHNRLRRRSSADSGARQTIEPTSRRRDPPSQSRPKIKYHDDICYTVVCIRSMVEKELRVSEIRYMQRVYSFNIYTFINEYTLCFYTEPGSYGGEMHNAGDVLLAANRGITTIMSGKLHDPDIIDRMLDTIMPRLPSHALVTA